jgi:LEA14-like dessication related protein
MRKFSTVVLAAAAMIGVAGCAMIGRGAFKQPVVHLHDVRVRGLGLQGGTLDVLLSVYNPNGYRLDASRLDYKLMLASDSVTVATGTVDNRFTVQSNDSTIVPIPVNFTYRGIGAAGQQLMQMGALMYHVQGDVTVASMVGSYTIPFSSVGRFTTTGITR